jgi:4-diphosphocytidyl-2-C-methyl-D-erythritol kinase
VNALLRVGEKRPDGYHDLVSIFLCLNWGDDLIVEEGERGAALDLLTEPALADLPPEKNLAGRAAALFREASGYDRSLKIRLLKRIPPGGGLGGGSSDAAAALRALDALAGTGFSPSRLAALAERLGSDVPFFLTGGAALVTGRGECVRSLPLDTPLWFVVVNPGFPSSTAEAFARLDAYRADVAAGTGCKAPPVPDKNEDFVETMVPFLAREPAVWPFDNDFLPVFRACGATGGVYDQILEELRTLGAAFSGLSGAGASCFGVFPHERAAREAENTLKQHWNFAQAAFFLASLPLPVIE